jgi:3-phenylpropionate/trans-cinnamate dioxygenase ferredoxin component
MNMTGFESVGTTAELPDGGRLSAVVADRAVLVFRAAGNLYCVEDVCSHDGQPLTDGPLVGCEIECPRHGARFHIGTGAALCMPATEGIRTFQVREEDGRLWIAVE